jgi:hypothetical protein
VAWRKPGSGPAAGAAAELAGYAGEYARAAGTDGQAARYLVAVRSWLAMLGAAGADREVGDLFVELARVDRAVWRGGVA